MENKLDREKKKKSLADASLKSKSALVPDEILDLIEKAVDSVGNGTVTVVVQDAHVVQIEKYEKIRVR